MKRRIITEFRSPVASRTRSKRPRLTVGLSTESKKLWIAATKTRNYMLDDALVDWLKRSSRRRSATQRSPSGYQNTFGGYQNTFGGYLMQQGNLFEQAVMRTIESEHQVEKAADFYSPQGVERTQELMIQGVPIISSAPVAGKKLRIFGIPDLLVRSDYLPRLCPDLVLPQSDLTRGSAINPNYHYVVVDIKFSTLKLAADGLHVLNAGSVAPFKAQLWVYTNALAEMQGYKPRCAFLLGRRWTHGATGRMSDHCFDRMGVVDFEGYDRKAVPKYERSLRWCRDLETKGVFWSLSPVPSRKELYPNMCRNSGKWQATKRSIAKELGDISEVWMCGTKHRSRALEQDIHSWRDPRLTASSMGFKGRTARTVDRMLSINRQDIIDVSPRRINASSGWRSSHNEVYVDFETFGDVFTSFDDMPRQKRGSIIYLVGVGKYEEGVWSYTSFIAKQATKDEELRVMRAFYEYLQALGFPTIRYWHAEHSFWSRACEEQYTVSDDDTKDELSNWHEILGNLVDMRRLFVDNSVVVRGCFGFGLKDIGAALIALGLVDTPQESECSDGRTAMVRAWNCYANMSNPLECGAMKDVIQYNERDCRLMGDIMIYLRQHH